MNSFPKKLVALFGGAIALFTLVALSTFAVRYKPYGVPDSRRAEYEAQVASLRESEQLVAELAGTAKPKMVVMHRVHDFGMLDPHSTATHEFEIKNEGEDPLALEVARTSCKCTAGTLGKSVLAAGESTNVQLTWNTGYKAESYEQTATIVSNDPLNPEVELMIKGEVRSDLVLPESVQFPKGDFGQQIETRFVVYSQTWNDFVIKDVAFDGDLIEAEWNAEPIEVSDPKLLDRDASGAWEIRLLTSQLAYGKFEGNLVVEVDPENGEATQQRMIPCSGKIRSAINFYGGDIDPNGLDIGTLNAGEDHQFHLVVRSRGDVERELEVLDVVPAELKTTLEPMAAPGSYRLTLTFPADCPTVVFNADQKHGYVQVGDPSDENYSNWFPLLGAIVSLSK